jgi:hypothetical protein
MNSPFLASAVSRQDGSPTDGIHLLWTAPPRIGYSIDGFDIQRRESQRRPFNCYSLTPSELATLHQMFRVRVPPGLVTVRRTPCPQFPDKGPDQPAPQPDPPTTEICTDFRKLPKGTGSNPRKEPTGNYTIRGANGQPLGQSMIRSSGVHIGLDCGFRLDIELAEAVEEVHLLLVRFAVSPKIAAIREDGSTAATASMSDAQGQAETVTLRGKSFRRLVIEAPQNELLLLELCLIPAVRQLSSTAERVDFSRLDPSTGPNPRTAGPAQLQIFDSNGHLLQKTRIQRTGDHAGLDCSFKTEITFATAVSAIELILVRSSEPPKIEAFRADGSTAAAASMTAAPGHTETVRLAGGHIQRVRIQAARNEILLLGFAVEGESSVAESQGQPSRFPQPPFQLHGPSSAPPGLLPSASVPVCRVYDIRLNEPHLVVRVLAGLPSALVIAMREGKAVNAQMLSAAGGEQAVTFGNQLIDQVLIYATTTATSLIICTDDMDPVKDAEQWKQVPFIATKIHLPVRSINTTLGSIAAEDALASSRLLAGETFDATSFHEVTTLMNDSSQNASSAAPPVQSVLTRENITDPFIEIHGWQYALSLLVEADWRRMLGFGFFDKGSALTPGTSYDYRITGRFRHGELHEKLLGFHTVPLGTALPVWFQLESVLVETPEPSVVDMFPKPSDSVLRAVGVKGIALAPKGLLGRCLSLTFHTPTRKAVLEFEPSAAQNLHFRAKTTDFISGLTGAVFSGPIPATRRVTLEFAEPVDTITLFGGGFFYGVRISTEPPPGSAAKPDDIIAAAVVIPGVRYEPTPPPPAPPFLGTINLQQVPITGDPVIATQQPPQHLGFHLFWLPPPLAGTTVVPWPPDLAMFPPFDVLGFHLERRRVDTADPFIDIDDAKPPTRMFGNRSGRRNPPQLYPGIDLIAVFPEEVRPEPPVSVLMDAEDTLRSLAQPAGPPPGSLHQYRIFSVDPIGRRSAVATLGSIVRLEKHVPPPLPVGPTTPPPPGIQRPVGVTARVLQSLDTRITTADRTLLGSSTNAIVLEWAWTANERARDPFATEFRVYFRPIPPDLVQGALTGSATVVGAEIEMTATLNQPIAADSTKGRYIRSGEVSFKVASNTAGQNIALHFEKSVLDPSAIPVAGAFEFPLPPDPTELRPERWPERTAIVPITASENYQFVFRDRLDPTAVLTDIRVWTGVSAADDQTYILDVLSSAVPNGGRPGNESSIVSVPAHARYLDRPAFTVPPPLPAVPEQVTNEPADNRVSVSLNLPALLPTVSVAPGFTVKLERISVDGLLNRTSAQTNGTIGVRLPSGALVTYTLANPTDHAAFLQQIRTGDARQVEGRFAMDLLLRQLNALETLWIAALPLPVSFGPAVDTLPEKAERYVHRIRLVDQAGHISAGGAILPQFVRVPSLASPASPSFTLPGSNTNTIALTARVHDGFDLKWLVVFTLIEDDSGKPDEHTLEKPQLLRLPSRRDLYPLNGIRLRLADGTLLEPAAAVDASAGTVAVPDRLFQVPIAAGFGKRVSVWTLAMTRDGITSRLAGPQTAFTGAPPLVVPALTVTPVSGVDQASWPALAPGVEASVERSTDAGATWQRVTSWTKATTVPLPLKTGNRRYRLRLRASHDRSATGTPVILT